MHLRHETSKTPIFARNALPTHPPAFSLPPRPIFKPVPRRRYWGHEAVEPAKWKPWVCRIRLNSKRVDFATSRGVFWTKRRKSRFSPEWHVGPTRHFGRIDASEPGREIRLNPNSPPTWGGSFGVIENVCEVLQKSDIPRETTHIMKKLTSCPPP